MGVSMPQIMEIKKLAEKAGLPASFARRMVIQGVSMDKIRSLMDAYKSDGVCYHQGMQWGQPQASSVTNDQ